VNIKVWLRAWGENTPPGHVWRRELVCSFLWHSPSPSSKPRGGLYIIKSPLLQGSLKSHTAAVSKTREVLPPVLLYFIRSSVVFFFFLPWDVPTYSKDIWAWILLLADPTESHTTFPARVWLTKVCQVYVNSFFGSRVS
jgi:hypothetical protein